jgi:excisionase family DNA binding protein
MTGTAASFTCPDCHRTSHHPDDAKYGYCGACHAFTGRKLIAAVDTIARIVEAEAGAAPEASLTTQEAADLLGVSHPALLGLLDDGKIPSEQRGGDDRRIRLADVLDYANKRRRRRQALDEIVEESRAAGLYDLPDSAYLDALREVRGPEGAARAYPDEPCPVAAAPGTAERGGHVHPHHPAHLWVWRSPAGPGELQWRRLEPGAAVPEGAMRCPGTDAAHAAVETAAEGREPQ